MFFENRAVYEIMWGKKIVEPDRSRMTIWRMRIAWDTYGYKHTPPYYFSTAKVIAQRRLNIRLYYIACLVEI
jgi:hypothetical protein